MLDTAGFCDITLDETSKAHWIVVVAKKSSTVSIEEKQ
jgi:hypothetical protein